ncbi:MAG: hypothetical protein RIE73_34405 [Coleofasciculus sp. C1-SOL-03]|jgi:hypothetical protein
MLVSESKSTLPTLFIYYPFHSMVRGLPPLYLVQEPLQQEVF